MSRNMRIQQHKMSLPPLPTTTLAIVINRVQRMGQILRHGEKVLQIVWWGGGGGGQKQARVENGKKKMPGALILPQISEQQVRKHDKTSVCVLQTSVSHPVSSAVGKGGMKGVLDGRAFLLLCSHAQCPRLRHFQPLRGVCTQRAHSANHYFVDPGNTPANHPYRSVRDPFKTASGVQNAGPWDPWLPGVENSRLSHSACTAQRGPLSSRVSNLRECSSIIAVRTAVQPSVMGKYRTVRRVAAISVERWAGPLTAASRTGVQCRVVCAA